MRRRVCSSKICLGCNQEWKTCNTQACLIHSKEIESDWVELDKVKGQNMEQRSRFECRFDPNSEGVGMDGMGVNVTNEYRICSGR